MADIPQANSGMSFNPSIFSKSQNNRYVGNGTQLLILLCAILLIILDWNYFRFGGVNLVKAYQSHMLTDIFIKGIISNGIFWLVLLAIYLVKKPQNKEEALSYIVVTAASFFALSMVGITDGLSYTNISALLHLLLIWFGARKIILSNNNDVMSANYMTFILIFLDFFLFNLIYSFFPKVPLNIINGAFIPIVPLYILFNIEQSILKTIGLFIVIGFYIFAVFDTYRANVDFQNKLNPAQLEGAKIKAKSSWENFINFFTNIKNTTITNINGDYYTGQVEQNQAKPLGVFLEDMKGDTEFIVGERVVVWSKLKVQSLQSNDKTGQDTLIKINVRCFLKDGIKQPVEGVITPKKDFSVTSFEEEFLQCTFDKDKLPKTAGYYPIIFNATFNFDTQGYMKAYYMDKERKRTLMAGNVDILSEYGITDSNPTAIYTNGPVKIGMETTTPLPIGVAAKIEEFSSYIGITIDKNWGEGNIKSIEKLWVVLPEGTNFGEGCTDFENLPSNEWDPVNGKEENVKVSIYKLKQTKIDSDNKKGLIIPKSYKCTLKLPSLASRETLLGQTPIALRYFKTMVSYNYMISRTTNINIKSDGTSYNGAPTGTGIEIIGSGYVGKTEIEKKVITEAIAKRVPTYIALALVQTESNFKHCEDGTTNCGTSTPDNLYCSSSSCGLMQINEEVWSNEYDASGASYNCGCTNGQTAYDWECNIKCGMWILKNKNYDVYVNNDDKYTNTVIKYCTDTTYKDRYLAYKGWNRALRAYNGFGCDTASADVNYVETVNSRFSNYK